MIFLADESVVRHVVELLRDEGYHLLSMAETQPGAPDEAVMDLAQSEHAILLTADKDFGELVFRQGRAAPGVVLIRLAGLSPEAKAKAVASALADHVSELENSFTVISPGFVRIRRRIA